MKSLVLKRRAMLAALGVGGASTLFPSLLGSRGSSARAEEIAPPKRLILIGARHGVVYDQFRLRPAGMPEEKAHGTNWQMPLTGRKTATMKAGGVDPNGQPWPSAWEVENVGEFSRILAPLSPFAAKMLVLDGLSLLPSIADPLIAPCNHTKGGISRWTGNASREVNQGVYAAFGPSIDQLIAKKIARPDRIPSLELGTNGQWNSRFDFDGNPLPTETSPLALHSRLFSANSNMPGANPQQLAHSSMLNFVQNEYNLLAPRMSGADRYKLEQHRDMVRDLEIRLAGLADAQCEAPLAPKDPSPAAPDTMRLRYESFMQLVTIALQCDLTRVVSILLPGAGNTDLGAPPGDIHSDFAHHAEDDPPNDLAHEVMTRYHTMNASLVAKLCALLDSVPEGQGTLLDNTVIAYFSDMANGTHDFHNYPVVLIGGGGKSLKTGRYLHYAQNLTPYGTWAGILRHAGMPHNKLLTTLGRIFGLESNFTSVESVQAVGHEIDCRGTLDELLA